LKIDDEYEHLDADACINSNFASAASAAGLKVKRHYIPCRSDNKRIDISSS